MHHITGIRKHTTFLRDLAAFLSAARCAFCTFFSAASLTFSACLAATAQSLSSFFAVASISFSFAIQAFSSSKASLPCFLAAWSAFWFATFFSD